MPELDIGDGSGDDTLSGVSTYLSNGGSVADLFTSSIAGLVISPFIAGIDIINAVTGFFTTPFTETAQSISALSGALFEAPLNLLETGAQISESTLALFLSDSLAGLFALPVAMGVVMLSVYMIVQYLQEAETGDTLPAVPIDVPTDVLGVEEESDPNE